MAHYVTTVHSPLTADEAFAYMADVRNFTAWDPGVRSSVLVSGDGPGPGSAYDVAVAVAGRPMTLRYEFTEYEPSHRLVLRAETRLLRSLDTVTVDAEDTGSRVVYDAELTLAGLLAVADPLLAVAFRRIGDRAAAGLRRALGASAAEG